MEYAWLGFPLTIFLGLIGFAFVCHGFSVVTINKHYHGKEDAN